MADGNTQLLDDDNEEAGPQGDSLDLAGGPHVIESDEQQERVIEQFGDVVVSTCFQPVHQNAFVCWELVS